AIGRDRHVHAQRVGPRGDVDLPADPHDRVAEAHQKAIAEIVFGRRIGRAAAVESVQDDFVATVEDVHQRDAVSGRGLRPEDVEIRRELDETGGVDRRLVEIDDQAIAPRLRIDREVDRADDLLVAGDPDVRASGDVDARDLRTRDGARDQHERRGQAEHPRHWNLKLFTNWLNAASHFATVCSGPVSLMKYGPFEVSTTPARIRNRGLL